jgi:hypothetical protein
LKYEAKTASVIHQTNFAGHEQFDITKLHSIEHGMGEGYFPFSKKGSMLEI